MIAADVSGNSIGILFNEGQEYWNGVRLFYKTHSRDIIYTSKSWKLIPLIDIYEEQLYNKRIRDFTVLKTKSNKRINFEIFAVYDDSLYWFVEKDLSIPGYVDWGSHKMEQNYLYCMTKCEIVIEKQKESLNNYYMILDIDVNEDTFPEFILYSSKDTTLYWIKKYVPYVTGFGWNSSFWIYMIVYIYLVSSIIGFFEFYKLKRLNDRMSSDKLVNSH